MDGLRVGRILRAVRMHKRLRQRDVAEAAGVSQSVTSRAERGLLPRISFDQLDRIAAVLGVSIFIDAKWSDGNVDRLIDHAHASIVEVVVAELRRDGWDVVVEFGFNHYGERGSVDVLAWHAATRTLLIVEVKSILTDLQATFASFATKVRIVPGLVRRERGWDARRIGRVIVLPGTTANRSTVARHQATFDATFPERMPGMRPWLRRPDRDLGGLWFLSTIPVGTRNATRRVRCRGRERSERRATHAGRPDRARMAGPGGTAVP
jgi:transcriptional regulator with XRE-family HTH domain